MQLPTCKTSSKPDAPSDEIKDNAILSISHLILLEVTFPLMSNFLDFLKVQL